MIPHDFLILVFSSRYFPTYNKMFSSSLSENIKKKKRELGKSWGIRYVNDTCESTRPGLDIHFSLDFYVGTE